ncbi:hypothetical protein [Sulfurovum sp.]|uniref:hypothetical protein n=1 Tax=Sulfurovum sp. TaxID=1969726 RepID=UPI0025FD0836|nr:hypothetical protein [Sulfurovum sp.]
MSRYYLKKFVWHVFIVLGIFSFLNAGDNGGYGSVSYTLMQSVCKDKPQLVEGGMPACTCSRVNMTHFNSSETFAFEALFRGNFTDSDADEIFAVTAGCEPHVNNWGGAMLFRKKGNRWQKIFYAPGYPGKCKKIDVSGRSELLCHGKYMNQGYGNDRLVLFGVTDNGLKAVKTLYSGESDEAAFDSKHKNTLVKSWKLYDADQDGYYDVVLYANQSGSVTKKITYLYQNGSFVQKQRRGSRDGGDVSERKTFQLNENGIEITLRYPAFIRAGQPFLLKAVMRNHKASARMGGLTLSFPDLRAMRIKTVQKTFDSVKSYGPQSKLYSSIIRLTIRSRYFVLEGWENQWPYDQSRSFLTKLTAPEGLDHLRINIRGVLLIGKKKRNRREVLSPRSSGRTDQQGYDVKQIIIPVKY